MVQVTALDHVVLICSDVAQTLSWYQRHLGLEGVRVEEWRNGLAPFPSLRVTPETIIDLIPGPAEGRGHLDHVCFVASSGELDALRKNPDFEIVEEGKRFGARGVADSIYAKDPDGLTVEVRAYPGH